MSYRTYSFQSTRLTTETEGGCDDTDKKGPKRSHTPRLGLGGCFFLLIIYILSHIQLLIYKIHKAERWKVATTRKGSNDASSGP